MGRISTPKYRVEYTTNGTCYLTPGAWKGRPTGDALRRHVDALEASFGPGGVNEQVGQQWPEVRIVQALVIRQADGKEMAFYRRYPEAFALPRA